MDTLSKGQIVSIRKILLEDLQQIAPHSFSVSVIEPLSEITELEKVLSNTGFWETDAGAVAVTENGSNRLVGTCQFFRSGPCIHGLEIGYIVHSELDRGRGYASEALRLLSDYLLTENTGLHRIQLTIETSNLASCRVAEKCDFQREGILRSSGFPPEHFDCYVYSKIRSSNP